MEGMALKVGHPPQTPLGHTQLCPPWPGWRLCPWPSFLLMPYAVNLRMSPPVPLHPSCELLQLR